MSTTTILRTPRISNSSNLTSTPFISRLPNELISYIQLLTLSHFEESWAHWKGQNFSLINELRKQLGSILLVSKRWSDVAIATPQLWRFVYWGNHDWPSFRNGITKNLRNFVQRSRSVELHVIIDAPESRTTEPVDSPPNSLAALVLALRMELINISNRVRSLVIVNLLPDLWPLGANWDALHDLLLLSNSSERWTGFDDLQCLRSLEIYEHTYSSVELVANSIQPSSIQTVLLEGCDCQSYRSFLQACANLKLLKLAHCRFDGPYLPIDVPEVHFAGMETHLENAVPLFGATVQTLRIGITNPDLIFGLRAGSFPVLKSLIAYYPHQTVPRFKALLAAAPSLRAFAFRGGIDFGQVGALLSLLLDRSIGLSRSGAHSSRGRITPGMMQAYANLPGAPASLTPMPRSASEPITGPGRPRPTASASTTTGTGSLPISPNFFAPSLSFLQITIPYSTRSQLDFDGPEILHAVLRSRPFLCIEIVANSSSLRVAAVVYQSVVDQFGGRLRLRATRSSDDEMRVTTEMMRGDNGLYGWSRPIAE